ncbi:MAG: ATP-binding cassette domain-containing protein [Acholeplasmataceae bacterium]|jgi:ABC-2 type transport system ATP-binding protein|nr:ATP-binding cassette domain-containing protein [Acholeplasmataceae bacterium]
MLKVENASFSYGHNKAVDNISFEIKPGEIFGLLGSNGSGKTTTFRMIMGLLTPDEGSITYFGHKISYEDVNEIGYMIEERSLMQKTTIEELILFFGGLKNMDVKTIDKRLDYWLDRFELSKYKKKKINELSKGNQQKIQFISAIINNPKLLILDEPFTGLDVLNTKLFVDVINDFKKQGSMIVFSSHQLDDVEEFCENIVILNKGKSAITGSIDQVKNDFKKQNIKIKAKNVDVNQIKEIAGVYDVVEFANHLEVKIESFEVSKEVFRYVKTLDDLEVYNVEKARLSDIFIETVGNNNE